MKDEGEGMKDLRLVTSTMYECVEGRVQGTVTAIQGDRAEQ